MICPECDEEMEHDEADHTTNIPGGWFCAECDTFVHDSDVDFSDDVTH